MNGLPLLVPVHPRPLSAETPQISVVIPVWNGGEKLVRLLAAIRAQRGVGEVEILVADSQSSDGSQEASLGAGARVFQVKRARFHHGQVRNAAIALCRASRISLFSQDAIPKENHYLATLQSFLSSRQDSGGVYARQVPGPGCDPFTEATLGSWTPQGRSRWTSAIGEKEWQALSPMERVERSRFDNVASMVRRDVWTSLPFPEEPFGEDIAWGSEALRRGRAIGYCSEAVVEHHHPPRVVALFRRNREAHRLLARRFGLVTVPTLAQATLAFLAGLPGSGRTALRAHRDSPRRASLLLARRMSWEAGSLLGQWWGGREGISQREINRRLG